ncbi:flagellar export protein FliJ [Photobacterium proteolyticum]|uniref:Flagellar FliJ protein n=1 Tax=Photobacterium proteolyticum TaxID=1903952 RepID=A0A1Q9GVG4_9GAMM|nr:flagellar export protein FliJ [Photobacterium proteolyticum]OLQ79154.1 flagellar export protein FliJ [Photobacterium proteolyticum]
MKNKVRAVSKLQQIAEQNRDRQSKVFEQQQQQASYFEQQLNALGALKAACQTLGANGSAHMSSTVLQNTASVQLMLSRMLHHHQHEKAVMDAECLRAKSQLEACHAKVKGLETVLERWKAKQHYEQAKKEQKQIEDLINARRKRKRL